MLALLLAGTWPPATVGAAPRACDFSDMRGTLESVFAELHIDAVRFEPTVSDAPYLHPGKAARVDIGGGGVWLRRRAPP
jgi:phenylalanyl-tRNA synthetase beta subunit